MTLMLAAMAASIVIGMLFRKHEAVWRFLILLLSVTVTAVYFIFADQAM